MMDQRNDVVFNCIVKPYKFLKELEDLKKEDVFKFLEQDFVFGSVLFSEDEEYSNELAEAMKHDIGMLCQPCTMLIDENDLFQLLKKFVEYAHNGISMGVEFYFKLIQITSSMYGKKIWYTSTQFVNRENQKLCRTYYIVTTDSNLVKDYLLEQVCKLIDNKLKEKVGRKTQIKKRDSLTKSIRYEVFKRDNFKCVFCGANKEQTRLHADHIIPPNKGGTDTLDNLQTLCESCNLSKSDRVLNKKEDGNGSIKDN